MRLPAVVAVDLARQRHGCRPVETVVLGVVEVEVRVGGILQLHGVPLGEDQQVVGDGDGGAPLPFRPVERGGQRLTHAETTMFLGAAAEELAAHLAALSEGGVVGHHLTAGEVEELSVGRKRAEVLVGTGGDIRHRLRVEGHRMVEDVVVEERLPQDQLSLLDLFGVFRVGEQVGIVHDDARELHRLRIVLVEIGDARGIEVAVRFEIGTHLEDAVERRQRFGHIGLVLPLGHELVILQGEIIPQRIVIVHVQIFGMFGQDFLVEFVGLLLLPRLVKIPRLFENLLAVLVHRLYARIILLRVARTGDAEA